MVWGLPHIQKLRAQGLLGYKIVAKLISMDLWQDFQKMKSNVRMDCEQILSSSQLRDASTLLADDIIPTNFLMFQGSPVLQCLSADVVLLSPS